MCVRAALARFAVSACHVIACASGVSGTAKAQSGSGGLSGLSEVRIAVESFDEEAHACGITRDILDAAVRVPLVHSRLTVASRARAFVYVAVAVIRPRGVCAGNVTVEVNRWSSEFNEFVTVWRRGLVLSSEPASFAAEASAAIELDTKELVAAWLRANP